mmetsp:Transcript_62557/g.111489  ORF Transcript_62557/g.111489 Transcript_62557/m.111489 type:complete len:207 (+) Transcript_62557:1918-2538(+)
MARQRARGPAASTCKRTSMSTSSPGREAQYITFCMPLHAFIRSWWLSNAPITTSTLLVSGSSKRCAESAPVGLRSTRTVYPRSSSFRSSTLPTGVSAPITRIEVPVPGSSSRTASSRTIRRPLPEEGEDRTPSILFVHARASYPKRKGVFCNVVNRSPCFRWAGASGSEIGTTVSGDSVSSADLSMTPALPLSPEVDIMAMYPSAG